MRDNLSNIYELDYNIENNLTVIFPELKDIIDKNDYVFSCVSNKKKDFRSGITCCSIAFTTSEVLTEDKLAPLHETSTTSMSRTL